MMETEAPLTEAELGAFAHKLNAFAESLSPRERDFLGNMLADAAYLANSDEAGYADLESALEDDVAGFDMGAGGNVLASVFEYGQGISRAQQEAADLAALV
jgi:hypothetical protein